MSHGIVFQGLRVCALCMVALLATVVPACAEPLPPLGLLPLRSLPKGRMAFAGKYGPGGGKTLPRHPNEVRDPGFFHVDLLTPSLQTQINGRPGTYIVEGPLRLRVTSSHPEWHLAIEATNLEMEGRDGIAASEFYLQARKEELLPLDEPQVLVETGPPGETEVEADLVLVTTEFHAIGTHSGWLLVKPQRPGEPELPPIEIPLEVEVRCRADLSIESSKVYFQVGNPFEADNLTATMNGRVTADAPMCLRLLAPDGRVDRLPHLRTLPGGRALEGDGIPMEWRLKDGSSGGMREPDTVISNGEGVSWLLDGTPGQVNYELGLTLQPEAHQAPGDYGTAVVVILEPLL